MFPKFKLPSFAALKIKIHEHVSSLREYLKKMSRMQKTFLAFVLISAILVVSFAFFIRGEKDNFSKLIIDPVYAKDNFSISATKSDSIGVENTTAFDIKSKSMVDEGLLRSSIALVPKTDFDFKKIDDQDFRVTPKEPLVNKQVYKVQIASAYMGDAGQKEERDYSWAFQVKDIFKVLQTLPRDQATGVPLNTGIEMTFSQDNFVDYESAVKIEPAVKGKFEQHGRTLVYVPESLTAGTLYTVTVSKDLKLSGSDNRMSDDYVFKFETDSNGAVRGADNTFNFEKDFSEFSTKRQPVFGIYEYNMPTNVMPIDVYAFKSEEDFIQAIKTRDSVPYWARYSRETYLEDTAGLSKVASLKLQVSKYSYQEFVTMPNTLPKGYYMVQAQAQGLTRQAYFQVTDLAVFTSVTNTDTLVWVNDLGTKSPLAGVSVKSIDGSIAATTNSNGAVTFATDKFFNLKSGDYADKYLEVSSGDVSTVVPLSISYSGPDSSSGDNYWYYFYNDKSLYKTNDTINYWGYVKSRSGDDVSGEITVRLTKGEYYDYYYDPIVINESKVQIKDGAITGKMNLQNITPGYYYLEFSKDGKTISTQYISVETYNKPAYELELTPEKAAVFAGENIVLHAQAKFFEGTPVANVGVTYTQDQNPAVQVATDSSGALAVTLPTTYEDCTHDPYVCRYPEYSNVSIHPTGAEEGDISADTSVRVFGAKVKANVTFVEEGNGKAKITTKVNKVDLDKINKGTMSSDDDYLADPVPAAEVNAELTEIDYKKTETGTYYDFINKIVRKQYSYEEIRKPLGTYAGVTDANGVQEYEMPIDQEKSYEVKVVVGDGAGRFDMVKQTLYTRNGSAVNSDNYNLEIANTGKENPSFFSLGENVNLSFVNNEVPLPENGGNNFLYYKLQNGLLSYDVSGKASYGFPFEEKFIPNIYVEGVWFDGETYHQSSASGWMSSGTAVYFDSSSRKLNISLRTDKDRYQPGEEVTLSAEVTDDKNQGVKTNLNLNLVDEAFYMLSQESVDTLSSLYNSYISSGELTSYESHELPAGYNGGAERGGCFAAGTKIKMADGSEKNIESVKAGDEILTFENEFAKRLVPAKVLETFKHRVQEYLIVNEKLKVTPEHRIFVNGGWEQIGSAKVGDYLTDENGQRVRINSIKRSQEIIPVYNLHIEKYSTYIADGIYVHNDKGGGRDNFVDNALFTSVTTDASGKAQVKFTLPDNITSWRVTAQGISNSLYAGSNTAKIAVSLPVFATNTFADEYLSVDKPTIKINSYGDALTADADVLYGVSAPTLGINYTAGGKAFQPQYVQIPQLTAGTHKVTTSVKYKDFEDKMTEPISVIDSRLTAIKQNYYTLINDLKIDGNPNGDTTLVFTDKGRGQFYDRIMSLEWTEGDRVDQKLSRLLAWDLEKKYFGAPGNYTENFDGNVYQLPSGGVALLPDGDADLELSAKIASVAPAYFDADNLKTYFYGVYNDKTSTSEQVGLALYGLASLGEPVLIPLEHFSAIDNLPVRTKIFAALSLNELGDTENARKIYSDIMDKYAEHLGTYVRLKVSDNQDEVLSDTILAAILAGGINDQYRDQLWNYSEDSNGKDILTNLDELMYISSVLPNLKSEEVSFTFSAGDKNADVVLNQGRSYRVSLTPDELKNISFSNIKGDVGVTSIYEIPATQKQASQYVSVGREYLVNGAKTNAFKENDLVQVLLTPTIKSDAPGEDYQMEDLLPSGLKIVTNPYVRDHTYGACTRYPFEVDGQKIKFYLGKSWYADPQCGNNYSYYARVISLGDYVAEPASIESLHSEAVKNFSPMDKVTIGK